MQTIDDATAPVASRRQNHTDAPKSICSDQLRDLSAFAVSSYRTRRHCPWFVNLL